MVTIEFKFLLAVPAFLTVTCIYCAFNRTHLLHDLAVSDWALIVGFRVLFHVTGFIVLFKSLRFEEGPPNIFLIKNSQWY